MMNSALIICYNKDKEIVDVTRTTPAGIGKDYLVEIVWEGLVTHYPNVPEAELIFIDCGYKYRGLLS